MGQVIQFTLNVLQVTVIDLLHLIPAVGLKAKQVFLPPDCRSLELTLRLLISKDHCTYLVPAISFSSRPTLVA
jgi:hypothetical protein